MLDGTIPLGSELPIPPKKIPVTDLKVSPNKITMAVGRTQQLSATIQPKNAYDKTVLWVTSDTTVITVNERGKVSGVGIGEAIITATVQEGTIKDECFVTVTTGVPVTGVTVSPTTLRMDVGRSQQLTATVSPVDALNKAVIWSSTDPLVVIVDENGLVTAISEGKTTIKVTTQDGAKTARCQITVVNPSQTPYLGMMHIIPGTIEAEDYDNGGEGVAYHDVDAANQGGQYRRSEGVDIENCGEGGYNVGWFNAGEWLEYSVEVSEAGRYNVDVRVATQLNGAKFHIEFEGRNRTGILEVPNTGGWQTYQTVSKTSVPLTVGPQVMRIYREIDGADFNINRITFKNSSTKVSKKSVNPSETFLNSAFPNPFNSTTTLSFQTAKKSPVKISIYDILGREIKILINQQLEPGFYSETWDSTNNSDKLVPTGIYFVRMQADNFVSVKKIVLVQ